MILIVNEIKDALLCIFPPKSVRKVMGSNTSFTGLLALTTILIPIFSVYTAQKGFYDLLSTGDYQIETALQWSYILAIALAVLVFVCMHLTFNNLAEFLCRYGNPNAFVMIGATVCVLIFSYVEYKRMAEGSKIIAQNVVGGNVGTERPVNPAIERNKLSILTQILEVKKEIAWCGKHETTGVFDKDEDGLPTLRCTEKGCKTFAITPRSKKTAKRYKKIDDLTEQYNNVLREDMAAATTYRTTAESTNLKKEERYNTLSEGGKTISLYLYIIMAIISFFLHIAKVSSWKSAGVAYSSGTGTTSGSSMFSGIGAWFSRLKAKIRGLRPNP